MSTNVAIGTNDEGDELKILLQVTSTYPDSIFSATIPLTPDYAEMLGAGLLRAARDTAVSRLTIVEGGKVKT